MKALRNVLKEAKESSSIRGSTDGIDWQAWIGMHDQFEEGNWVTILDDAFEEFEYKIWAIILGEQQPSDRNHENNCGALCVDGTFDDVKCEFKFPYICEYN